jgi:MEDS: MEthanogen/methylotroph, DcmR Sensory domain
MTSDLSETLWGELSACEHFVQFYEDDRAFVGTLAIFIAGGLSAGEAAVLIATPRHRDDVEASLLAMGIDTTAAKAQGRLITLDAKETMDKFLVNGWPDDIRFTAVVTEIISRATRTGRKVRVFGEMVALMWAEGRCGATVRLEHLWTAMCQRESFPLFCAYPNGLTENASESMARVRAAHSRVLATA